MISDIASRWLGEFSECLRTRLEAQGAGVPEAGEVESAQPIPGISSDWLCSGTQSPAA